MCIVPQALGLAPYPYPDLDPDPDPDPYPYRYPDPGIIMHPDTRHERWTTLAAPCGTVGTAARYQVKP